MFVPSDSSRVKTRGAAVLSPATPSQAEKGLESLLAAQKKSAGELETKLEAVAAAPEPKRSGK